MENTSNAKEDSVFGREFDEDTQRELTNDDAFAWRSVTGLLIFIISIGLLIAVVAVALAH